MVLLSFDPFDKKAREEWVSKNDEVVVKKKLERLGKYLIDRASMPPNGEEEWEWIDKNPKEWDSLRSFVRNELERRSKK